MCHGQYRLTNYQAVCEAVNGRVMRRRYTSAQEAVLRNM